MNLPLSKSYSVPEAFSPEELDRLNKSFGKAKPEEIIDWALEECYPNLAMTTALQVSGVMLMDLIHKLEPGVPFVFIDTGYHFQETLAFRDRLIEEKGYNIITIKPFLEPAEFEAKFGKRLFEKDPDTCCKMNKVQPRLDYINETGITNWISGLRRDQGGKRSSIQPLALDPTRGLRIQPLTYTTWSEVWNYIKENRLPYHKLYDKGFSSIGCRPANCTKPNPIENGERNGRWAGSEKTECGLHFPNNSHPSYSSISLNPGRNGNSI